MERYKSQFTESVRLDPDTEDAILYLQNKYLQFYKRDMDKFVELVSEELDVPISIAREYLGEMGLL